MIKTLSITLLAMLLAIVLFGCDDDAKDPVVVGTLTGKVIFHGDWPDSGTVQLSIFEGWDVSGANCSWCVEAAGGPPSYYTDANFFQDPDPTNLNDADTLTFEITGITLGSYDAAVAGWRAPNPSVITCDEPVIGLFGADPFTDDSLPGVLVFSGESQTLDITVDAYFDHFLPVPGCDDIGRIEGIVEFSSGWPSEEILVMLTTFPASGWQPVMQQPSGYKFPTETDPTFQFLPPFGIYYLSLWTNAQPPAPLFWYGSYGVNTQAGDANPDAITLDSANAAYYNLTIDGQNPAPHYISGDVTFNGTRPAVGLLVLLSTFPFSPEHPPQGAPSGYFPITDEHETLYAFSGMAADTFYVSLWDNVPPPTEPRFFGAYGYVHDFDTDPDPVVISADAWGAVGINIEGTP